MSKGLDDLLRDQVERRRVVGLSVAVVRLGELAFTASKGHADLATGADANETTAYLWFSMTKVVTATAVMQLMEQGLIDLEAPVETYLADFKAVRQPTPVTVRHLLAHTSGLANPPPVRWVHPLGEEGPEPAAFTRRLLSRYSRLRFPPGEQSRYTNLGYLVLGEVVASVSGEPYRQYVTRAILEPLGMTGTSFGEPSGGHDTTVYQRMPRVLTPALRAALPKGIVGSRHGRFLSYRPFRLDGSSYGGLIGPAGDAARFLAAHLNGGALGQVRILSTESARAMQRIESPGRKYDVGLGWLRPRNARDTRPFFIEHPGGGLGVYNTMRMYPELDAGTVVMSNTPGYDLEAVVRSSVAITL